MRVIHQLPQTVISKIAAGEVIERPVFAVKELIENAIDAGASSITIQLEDSGLKGITVIDNGKGMSAEDLAESYKPHTTSKLTTEEDLDHIQTLGFRGEALSSIAAISHLTIASRKKGASGGMSITINNGKADKITPYGMPEGTIIIVRGLFGSVPGRKKFLKSPRTELRHITEYVTRVALMHPEIHLALSHNKRLLFDLPPSSDMLERIPRLLGANVFEALLPIAFEDNGIKLSGFITRPQASGSRMQYLALNNRSITDAGVNSAVKAAYGSLLEQTAQPTYILNMSLPWEFVDVNVHPRKETVRFMNQEAMFEAVMQAVKQTLNKFNIQYQADVHGGFTLKDEEATQRQGQLNSYAARLLKEKRVPWSLQAITQVSGTNALQLHNLYIVAESKFGLVLVDQHAAHERILYEELSQLFQEQQGKLAQYVFPKPLVLTIGVSDRLALQEYLLLFQKMQFDIEHFSDNTFHLRGVPLLFQDRKHEELLLELLNDMRENKTKSLDKLSHRMIAYLACRGSVKAGDSLSKKQVTELLKKLSTVPNNATCPHGRPTRVEVSLSKLHKMFKRK